MTIHPEYGLPASVSDVTMDCPYTACQTKSRFIFDGKMVQRKAGDNNKGLAAYLVDALCPSCDQLVIQFVQVDMRIPSAKKVAMAGVPTRPVEHTERVTVYPATRLRRAPEAVPDTIRRDYEEAVRTLRVSSNASAAMSRRCLQNVLLDAGGVTTKKLYEQIEEVMPSLPSYLSDELHDVREIGNYAAHPTKSQNTGEIVDAEPGEAEWNLDTLDALFDHYYVKPASLRIRKEHLATKKKSTRRG